jgi:hypothetical protein
VKSRVLALERRGRRGLRPRRGRRSQDGARPRHCAPQALRASRAGLHGSDLFGYANILFSAAYHPDSGLRRLWSLPGVQRITSIYAAEETRRNLSQPMQREDLEELLDSVEITATAASKGRPLFSTIELPDKDQPLCSRRSALGRRTYSSATSSTSARTMERELRGFSSSRQEIISLREPDSSGSSKSHGALHAPFKLLFPAKKP